MSVDDDDTRRSSDTGSVRIADPRALDLHGRRRLVAGAVLLALVVALVVVVLAVAGGGSGGSAGGAPASEAAKLVPADTLVYVHVSTDRHRKATTRANDLAEQFPSWPALRDGIVKRLSAPGCRVGADALRTSKEAALALFDTGSGGTANSLVLVDTGKDHGTSSPQRGCGALSMTYVGTFLAIGQPESLRLAQQLHQGKGKSLADSPDAKKVFAQLPEDRAADGWV